MCNFIIFGLLGTVIMPLKAFYHWSEVALKDCVHLDQQPDDIWPLGTKTSLGD